MNPNSEPQTETDAMTPGDIHPKSSLFAHPCAKVFPMLDQKSMSLQIDSLKQHGQKTKIVIHEGLVLDGRNTLFGCIEAGLKPEFRNFGDDPGDGDSPAAYVITHNLHRRHLHPSERATAAVEFIPLFEAEAQGRMKAGQFQKGGKKNAKKAATGTIPLPMTPTDAEAGAPGEIVDSDPLGINADPGTDNGQGPGLVLLPDANAQTGTPEAGAGEAPAGGKKASKKGTSAAALAAELFGTSPTMVKLAKKLKTKHPELYSKVLNKELTVTAAAAEAAKAEKDAQQGISKQTERTERIEAIKALEKRFGEKSALVEAATTKKILKKHSDLLKYADMPKKKAFAILPLIKLGMSPDKASAFLDATVTGETCVADLIAMALLKAGDKPGAEVSYVAVHDGFTFTVYREAAETHVPQSEPEPESEAPAGEPDA